MFELGLLPRSLGASLRDLLSTRPEVRISALRDLARHARAGEGEAASALVQALKDDSAQVRAAGALGLADAGVERAVIHLLRLAGGDASGEVRQMALLALGELATKDHAEVIQALEAAERAEAPAERFQALLALHQIGAQRAPQAIIEGTVDPDPEVRRIAFRLAEAEWASGELPDLLRARARSALGDGVAHVRCAAALCLAHFGDAAGQAVLHDLLASKIPDVRADDEQAAIEAAARLRLPFAIPLLTRRAFRWFGRDPQGYHARIALARLGDERARTSILRGLSAWTFDARTLAVAAAGRAGLVEARPHIEALRARRGGADAAAISEALEQLAATEPQP